MKNKLDSKNLSDTSYPKSSEKNNKKSSLKALMTYASNYKFLIALVIFFSLAETLTAVVSPKIAGMAITTLSGGVSSGVYSIDFDYLFKILALLFVLYSVFALSSCLRSYFITVITVKMTYRLREDISKKLNRLTVNYLESTSHGDILSRIMNDVETFSSAFTQSISQVVSSFVMGIGVLFMMFYISWEMTLVSLITLPIMAVIVLIVLKKSQRHFVEYQENLGKVNGFIEENFTGYEVLKAFGAEEKAKMEFNNFNNKMYDSSWKSQFASGLTSPIMNFISSLGYVVACVMGGYFAVVRAFAIGDISAFIAYSGQFTQPLIQISGISGLIQQTLAASDRIFEFLRAPEEPDDNSKSFLLNNSEFIKKEIKQLDSDIEFKNISFGYEEEKPIIRNFSFKIMPGQSVAVVGETGAGKTTLIKLLMRFYDVSDGEILLGSKNIKEFKIDEYRKLFGIVTQDSWLYNATIMENIRYGNLKASDSEVKQAAEFVGAGHFIKSLPSGYETMVEEGASNISEGQKQLICIARMVLSNSPIFILDEATASVDTCTESYIQNALSRVLKGKTSIVIAHRLSTIKNSDVILVIDKGVLLEHGTHSELLKSQGVYYDLYMSQFEKVI